MSSSHDGVKALSVVWPLLLKEPLECNPVNENSGLRSGVEV